MSDDPNSNKSEYPEQLHTGHVGFGPEYGQGPSFHEKIKGLKEEVKGKLMGNPQLVEQGKERRTGELKKQQQEEADEHNPFGAAGQK